MKATTNKDWSKLGFFVVAIIWGASFAFQRTIIKDIGAINFTFWSFFISALIFLIYALLRNANLLYRIREGIILGILLSGIEIFQMVGLKLSTAADTAFLSNVGMLLVPYLGWILLRHKVTLKNNLSLVVAAVGMYFLVGGLRGFGLGEFYLLVSALFMAFYFLYLERYDGEKHSHVLTLCVQQFFVISVICLVCGWFVGSGFYVGENQVSYLLWLTIIFTTIPYAIVQWASKYADEMIVAMYDGVVEPLVGGIVAWMIFLEPTTPLEVSGGLLMILAFGFTGIFSRRHFLIKGIK